MIRPPPRSTFFPNTTSSRSPLPAVAESVDGDRIQTMLGMGIDSKPPSAAARLSGGRIPGLPTGKPGIRPPLSRARSEEHTSELQSHLNLVCRLLLEKKKTTT